MPMTIRFLQYRSYCDPTNYWLVTCAYCTIDIYMHTSKKTQVRKDTQIIRIEV